LEDFRSNPEAQDTAFHNLTVKNWNYLRNYLPYVGQTIGGVRITLSGLLAGAHLVGNGAVKQFLDSNGVNVPEDGNHVPVTEYIRKFAGHDFRFDNDTKGFGGVSSKSVPYLAQTQALDPAFGATQWLQRPTSPNMLQPDTAPPFAPSAGAPEHAATQYLDETRRAQQMLGNLPHAPSAVPQPAAPTSPLQNGGPKPPQRGPTAPPVRSPQLQPSRPGIGPPLDITPQLAPRMPIPGAAGPAPVTDGLPPLHFAPETPRSFGPFEVPGLFRSDVFGGPRVAHAADGTPTNPLIPPMPAFGEPNTSAPAVSGMTAPLRGDNAFTDWWNGLVASVSAASRQAGLGGLSPPVPNNVPAPPTQPLFDRGLPGMLQRAGAFDPPAGGLLGRLLELQRNHPDDDDAFA
jgi:hypothetical protein